MASFHNAYADNIALRLRGDEADLDGLARPAASISSISTQAPSVPALDHVFVVMMENTNCADVVRTLNSRPVVDQHMPFLGSLVKRGVLLANAWQTYHPSDQNYVAMVAGDTFRYGPVYFPHYHLPVLHLGDLLESRADRARWV